MNTDIVLPQGNEEAFLAMAEKLGYENLVFWYPDEKKIREITHPKIKIKIATPLRTKKTDLVIAEHSEKDRTLLERKEVQVLFNLENEQRKDFFHQRASGFNQIIANLCKESNVVVCFSHHEIMLDPARVLGRMMQNVILCRKYHVAMALASFARNPYHMRAPHDMKALAIVLGMHPSEAKEAMKIIMRRERLE